MPRLFEKMWGFAPVPDADLFSSGMSDETGTARAGALKDNAVIQPLEAARLSLSISMIRRPGVMEEDADAEGELATQNAEGSRSHPEVAVGSLPSSSCRRAHAGPDSARPPSMPECLWSGHLRHNDAGVDHTLVKFSWCAPSAIRRRIGTWCGCDSRASHPHSSSQLNIASTRVGQIANTS